MQSKPILRFRVYPEVGSSLYATVIVWPTRYLLLKALNKKDHKVQAFCLGLKRYTHIEYEDGTVKSTLKREFAEIHLCAKEITLDIISHETGHACMSWAERIKINPSQLITAIPKGQNIKASCDEERFCYALGYMTEYITKKIVAHKLGKI